MHISYEQAEARTGLATFQVEKNESVFVLHPKQIVAFQGQPPQREDSFMKLPGMYRKKRLIQSRIHGPCRFMLGLPEGYCISSVPVEGDDDLLFDFRNVLFYSEGISFRSQVQTVRNAMITRDLVKMRFKGPGTLGLITAGPLYQAELDPEQPLFVDIGCLVAYPHKATIRLSVYGNTLASQHMNYHWELTGSGPVLLQPCKSDKALDEQMRDDGLLRRVLREVIPFGGVFIR